MKKKKLISLIVIMLTILLIGCKNEHVHVYDIPYNNNATFLAKGLYGYFCECGQKNWDLHDKLGSTATSIPDLFETVNGLRGTIELRDKEGVSKDNKIAILRGGNSNVKDSNYYGPFMELSADDYLSVDLERLPMVKPIIDLSLFEENSYFGIEYTLTPFDGGEDITFNKYYFYLNGTEQDSEKYLYEVEDFDLQLTTAELDEILSECLISTPKTNNFSFGLRKGYWVYVYSMSSLTFPDLIFGEELIANCNENKVSFDSRIRGDGKIKDHYIDLPYKYFSIFAGTFNFYYSKIQFVGIKDFVALVSIENDSSSFIE